MKSSVSEQAFFQLVAPDLAQLQDVVLKELENYDAELVASATHLMKAGGKRLRPLMVLLAARASDPNAGESLAHKHHLLAMAVEILHTATLIHDDIIDGSDTRRGLPTVNNKWGLRTSVLTGDFLLARSCYYISMIEKVHLNTIFSQMVMDMCNGEMTQLRRRYTTDFSLEEYVDQIRRKTALLMAVGCQGAGIINGQSPAVEKALYTYGHDVGIAFQIMDDMLDFTVSSEDLGKAAHNDLIQGQVTLPTFYALHHSPHAQELKDIIASKTEDTVRLQRALEIVIDSNALELCTQEADRYLQQALEALHILPQSKAREALVELAHFCVHRSQ